VTKVVFVGGLPVRERMPRWAKVLIVVAGWALLLTTALCAGGCAVVVQGPAVQVNVPSHGHGYGYPRPAYGGYSRRPYVGNADVRVWLSPVLVAKADRYCVSYVVGDRQADRGCLSPTLSTTVSVNGRDFLPYGVTEGTFLVRVTVYRRGAPIGCASREFRVGRTFSYPNFPVSRLD
jgi:hypothetical protein